MVQKNYSFCILLLFFTSICFSQSKNFKSFDDVKIVFSDEGEGEPVLLIHGFINSRKSWDKTQLKQDLLDKGYRVIVPDLRGNGDSDKPQDEVAYENDAEVKDLKLLMNSLNTKGAVDYAKSIYADLRSLHLQQKYQPVTSKKKLGKIKIDVMVICGDKDSDNGNAKELSNAFVNGILARVPGDHNGTYKTADFSDEVLRFLD